MACVTIETGTYKMRGDPAREQSTLVSLRQSFGELVNADLLNQRLRDSPCEDMLPHGEVIVEIRALQFRLQVVQRARKFIRDESTRLGTCRPGMLLPDARELRSRILCNLALNVLDVALVERRRDPILEDHQVDVFLSRERKTGEHFQRGAGDTTYQN